MAEFAAKLGVVEQELNETDYWLELLVESGQIPRKRLQPLLEELGEIRAMTVASIKTSKSKRRTT